jgi:predicted DNA-binding protein
MARRGKDTERERRIAERIRLLRGTLDANPKLARRTQALLADKLDAPDLEKTMNEEQIAIRLPSDALKRAEALAEKLAKTPALAAVRVSRSAVLRMAILRGLDELETEAGARPRRQR